MSVACCVLRVGRGRNSFRYPIDRSNSALGRSNESRYVYEYFVYEYFVYEYFLVQNKQPWARTTKPRSVNGGGFCVVEMACDS